VPEIILHSTADASRLAALLRACIPRWVTRHSSRRDEPCASTLSVLI